MSTVINQFLAMLDNFPHHAELKKSLVFIQNMQREIKEQNLHLTQLSDEHYVNQIVCNYCWRLDENDNFIIEDEFVAAVMGIVNKMSSEQISQMYEGLEVIPRKGVEFTHRTCREQFEFDIRNIPKLDLSRSESGGYKHLWVQRAYTLVKKNTFRLLTQINMRKKMVGPYYIAARDENHQLVFSEKPVRHSSFQHTLKEAKRLSSVSGKSFTILSQVATINPQECEQSVDLKNV